MSLRLGFDRLWLLIAVALPALVALLVPLPAVDLAYQVRAGEDILRTGALPTVDTFTFTVAGRPWTDQQWLAQVILAAGFRVGGWELLAVARAALVTGSLALLAATAMARGTGARTAAMLTLLAFALAAPALALRPQLFGILLFAALLWLVATRQDHPRRVWVAPLLVALWANVHGSFVLAPLPLGYAWVDDLARGRHARTSFLVLAAGIAATLVNPLGLGVWSYAAGIGANPVIASEVTEWQRTTPFTVPGLLFYASVVAAGAVSVAGRARLRWPDWLWLAGMAAIGAWTVRGLAWWPFGAVFVVAAAIPGLRTIAAASPSGPARATTANAILAIVLGLGLIVALPWWRPADPLTGRQGLLSYAPSGLAMALRDAPREGVRVVTPQAWASWFEWAAPGQGYFLDSRFELFPAEVWADYEAIRAGGPAAAEALRRWDASVLVLPPGAPAPPAPWQAGYSDADGAVYTPSLESGERTNIAP